MTELAQPHLKLVIVRRGEGETRRFPARNCEILLKEGSEPVVLKSREKKMPLRKRTYTQDLRSQQQGEVLKVGFLRKKGHVRRNWLDRWFVLTTEGIYYYKNRLVSPHFDSVRESVCVSVCCVSECLECVYTLGTVCA